MTTIMRKEDHNGEKEKKMMRRKKKKTTAPSCSSSFFFSSSSPSVSSTLRERVWNFQARRYSSSFSFLGRQTEVSPFLLLRLVSSSFSPGFLLKRRKKGWRGRETIRYTIVDRFSSSFSPSYSRHLSPRCPSFSPVSSPLLRVLSFSSSSFSSSIALSSSPQVSLSSCSFGSRNLHYLSSSRKSSSHTSPIASISRYHSTPLYHASVYTPYHSSSNSPDSPGTPSAIHQRQRNIFSPSSTLLSSPSSSSSSSLPFLPEISSSSSPFSLSLISSFSFSSSFSPLLIFPSSSFLSSSSPLLLFPSSPSTSLLSPSSCSSSFSLLCFYRSLFSKRSPGLKIPRLDRIYAMTPRELRNSVVDCARRHIYMKELWDAFLYRCVVLRSEFKPEQIAVILRSLSSLKRCPDQSFLDYMIEEIRMQVHLYRFQDLSLLFSALARLQIQDELLLRAFLPVILKRLSSSSSLSSKSISLFFHSYVRMNGPDLDVVASRVVSSLVGRLSSLREPQTLTLLLLSFSEHARKEVEKNLLISISFFHYQEKHEGKAKNNLLSSCTYTSDEHVGGKERRLFTPSSSMMLSDVPPITISFRLFLESLLEQVGKHLRDFRGQDTSATLSALTNLFACNRYLELYQAYVTENPHISQNDTRKKIKSSLSEDDGRDEDEGSDKDHFIQRKKQEEEEERLSGVYREGDSDWMMGREISPLLLNEILEKFLRRLTEVSFELQSQDLLTLFRSVHTLQELQHSYHYDPLIDFRGLLSSRRPFFLFNTNATISPIKFLHISSSLRRMYTRHKEDDRDEEGERQTRLSPERIEHADRLSRDQMSRRTTEGGKSRQQNAIERLESYLVKEIPYRVDSLDPHVAHELLLILSSQQHLPRSTGAQFYPGLEAALCVKLADTARTVFETSSFSSSSSSSSPHLRPSSSSPPPIGISWIETLCRLYAPATHPCLLPSFTLTSLSSSSSFGGPSFDSSLEESCEKGGILSSSLFHSRQKNERRRGREIEQELRPYRFPLPVAQCFAEMFRKKSLPRLDAKTAASLCWACVAFRIKDSRLVNLLLIQKDSILLTPPKPSRLDYESDLFEEQEKDEEREEEKKEKSEDLVEDEKKGEKEGHVTDTVEEQEEIRDHEEEEEKKKKSRRQDEEEAKAHALASLAGGLAQLGLSYVAEELAIFPILSTVEHFENVEIPLMILMAASVFDLTHQRPQTLSNFLLKPPAQALYDKRGDLPPLFYPSLTFISFSSILSSCPRHIISFFTNPSDYLSSSSSSFPSTSPSSSSLMSMIPTIAPYLSRVSTADLLGYTSSVVKPRYIRSCGRLPYGASRSLSLDLLLSEIDASTMRSLLYQGGATSRELLKRRRRKIISPCNVLLSPTGETAGVTEMSERPENAIEEKDHGREEKDRDFDPVRKMDHVTQEEKGDGMHKDKREMIGRGRKRRERRRKREGEEADRIMEGDDGVGQQERREDREYSFRSSLNEEEREGEEEDEDESLDWMDHMNEEEVEEERDRSSFKQRKRKDPGEAFLTFPERVKKELLSWRDVKISCDVPIAPFVLPFAIDMHSLSRYLDQSPCEENTQKKASCLDQPTLQTPHENSRSLLKAGEEEEEEISPETHILVDLLWKDFDFYIDLKNSSPASSASSPSSSFASGFSSFLSKERSRQNKSGIHGRYSQDIQREEKEEKEKEQEKRRSRQSSQEEEDPGKVSVHLNVQQPRRCLSKSSYQPDNVFSEDFSSFSSFSHLQENKEIHPLNEVATSEKRDREVAGDRKREGTPTSWSSSFPSVDDKSHNKEDINILTVRRKERSPGEPLDGDRKEEEEEEEKRRRGSMENQKTKKRDGPLLCAGKHAELNALRRQGWRVICISEVTWLELEEEILRRRKEMKEKEEEDEGEERKARLTDDRLDLFKRYILTCIAALGKRKNGEKATPR